MEPPQWSLRFAFAAFAGWLLLLLVLVLSALWFVPDATKTLRGPPEAVLIVAYLLLFVALRWWLARRNLRLAALGFHRFRTSTAVKYILGFPLLLLVIIVALAAAATIVELTPDDVPEPPPRPRQAGPTPMALLATLVLAPIAEEILFRGLLLPAAAAKFGFAKGAVMSSIMFSLLHLPNPATVLLTMLGGMYLAQMYRRTGSIVPGIILHVGLNAALLLAG